MLFLRDQWMQRMKYKHRHVMAVYAGSTIIFFCGKIYLFFAWQKRGGGVPQGLM